MPRVEMEIEPMSGLPEKEYLKKPELPKSTEPIKEKKKRVVSQKQLDSLKKAREASVAKRKKIREEKEAEKKLIKPKKEKKKLEVIKEESSEEESSEESSSEEEYIPEPPKPIKKSKKKRGRKIDYDAIINGVVGQLHSRQDEDRGRWRKEWEDAEQIRADERNKLLGLVKQMEVADSMKKQKQKPATKAQFNVNNLLKPQRGNSEPNWDNCFNSRSDRYKY